jgi:hypothetical protein
VKKKIVIPILAVALIVFVSGYIQLSYKGLNTLEVTPAAVSGIGVADTSTVEESTISKKCISNTNISYSYYKETDKLWEKNNKFGLYIYAEEPDMFELAQKLVNSNGGEWGYVLIPYNVKDLDYGKWSRVFEQLRSKKLIPIIQLWDVNISDYKKQTQKAADFLNGFLWPIKYKYISVYNETNDSKFWYGNADPEEYAKILDYTIKTFKKENEDFFMINGAFNITTSSDDLRMDAFEYMKKMNEKVPGIFGKLDGWASHPYPQPNFAGDPNTVGRWGIRAYEEELKFLKDKLGVKNDLPVFITETGWAHAEGANYNPSYLPVKTVAENLKIAYEDYWLKDDRVRAVTPFTIRYDPPFDHFSWVNQDNVPYLHYEVIKSLKKVKGEPPYLLEEVFNEEGCN